MFNGVVRIKDFEKESKKREREEKAKKKLNDVADFIRNHKSEIAIILPATIGLASAGVKGVVKINRLKKEQNLKDLYCYDNSLGHYWRLRRRLSNREWVEIDRRKRTGERLADILSDFGVLK